MLRVGFRDSEKAVIIRLEGALVAEFAEAVKQSVLRGDIHRRLVVDISEILFIDALGEGVLSWLKRIGGAFIADSSYSLHVCERLELPLANKARHEPWNTDIISE